MSKATKSEGLRDWMPAHYRIEVQGFLDEEWTERLANMRIRSRTDVDQLKVTTLTGRIVDQAELFGVLNCLYELHLPILSVNIIATQNGILNGKLFR